MNFSENDLIKIVELASTITERLSTEFILDESQDNDYIIISRIQQWCEVAAQGNWENFEAHLACYGLDIKTAHRAIGAVRMTNDNDLPNWVKTLNEYLKAIALVDIDAVKTGDFRNYCYLDTQEPIPFQEVLVPFIYIAKQKVITQVGSHYNLLTGKAHASLERNLLKRLSSLCLPSMQLEFSVFRACKQSPIDRLIKQSFGEYSRKQYQDFIQDLLESQVLFFIQKYPVLARLMSTVTNFWIDSTGEFITRLALDRSEIQREFNCKIELGQVVAIKPDLSDYHYNGRSVMAVTFASGLKLIYKPKEISLEQAYFKLLSWLNEQGFFLHFKLVRILNRSTYGWVEFIENLPCRDKEEGKRYYQRSGALLCLAHLLKTTDLHRENIIACGEHPVLIDLETLMHPWPHNFKNLESVKNAEYIAKYKLGHSVIRTGLLPRWELSLEKQEYDISGWGGFGQQKTFFPIAKVHNINTDAMVVKYENEEMYKGHNTPFLGQIYLEINDYIEYIIDGFKKMYYFLIEKRQEILCTQSPLEWLDNHKIRYIFRSTKIYKLILQTVIDPKFMQDGVLWSIQMDIISRVMFLPGNSPRLAPLVQEEKKGLEKMDIPLFFTASNSTSLMLSNDRKLDYFTEDGKSLVISYLKNLNCEDLGQQLDFIKGSLYSRITNDVHNSLQIYNSQSNIDTINAITQQELVQEATMLAADIHKRAIHSNNGSITWIAPQYSLDIQRFQLAPLSYGLYDGLGGVALFLTAIERITEKSGFCTLAPAAFHYLRENFKVAIATQIAEGIGIGGSFGCGSIIYVLVRISQFIDLPSLLEDAQKIASLITFELIVKEDKKNIFSGYASTILGLLALYSKSVQQEFIELAIGCGNHLLSNRVTSKSGYRTWATSDGKLLTGFSHGAAGIAYALLRLYQTTGETEFLEAAEEAITYERSVFIPEVSNWPDFRQSSTKDSPTCMCSWCHGAPGIGLARVAGLDILDTPEIRQDIEAAINTTKQHGLSNIDHLCCGNLGRIEFLFTAGRKLNRPELIETAKQQAAQVVARAKQRGHFGYGSCLTFHPGFFQGASGIGYELLRLAYPDILPSVLLWE
ncbi:type 2 lanthipeptide synthetase LanM family protein [Floridanema aerugineum]|uniref:Type 2 lanthipeptide synthetase LanM family protein n=1 Tax=Floridaenema aerugineum BLCC-F46 TaxID=3153654 RepID=A0ABV4XDN2_9CYAN